MCAAASAFPLLRLTPPIPRHLTANPDDCKPRSPPCHPAVNPAARSPRSIRRRRGGFPFFAGDNRNGLSKEAAQQPNGDEPATAGKEGEARTTASSGGGGQEPPPRRPAPSGGIRWRELLLDPDPDNVLAVGLTGLLAWASVQVLWQLFFISMAILLAALKYSFIAALLLFIIITLL